MPTLMEIVANLAARVQAGDLAYEEAIAELSPGLTEIGAASLLDPAIAALRPPATRTKPLSAGSAAKPITEPVPTVRLASDDEMMARLTDYSPDPHCIEKLYPLFVEELGGKVVTALGVMNGLTRAVAEYVRNLGLPSRLADNQSTILMIEFPDFVGAMVPDSSERDLVLQCWLKIESKIR